MRIYDVAKDFQSIGAAIVAFIAAVIAYNSTQRAAALARETSLDVLINSQAGVQAKEQRDAIKLSTAILLEISSDLDVVRRHSETHIMLMQEMIREMQEKQCIEVFRNVLASWQRMCLYDPGKLAILFVVTISHEKLSLFQPRLQREIHLVASKIRTYTQACNFAASIFLKEDPVSFYFSLKLALDYLSEMNICACQLSAIVKSGISEAASCLEISDNLPKTNERNPDAVGE